MRIMKNGVPQYVFTSDERTLIYHKGGENGRYDINTGNRIKKVAIYNATTGALLGVAKLDANSTYNFWFYKRDKGAIFLNWYMADIPNSENIPILVKVSTQIDKMPTTLYFYDTSSDDN